MFFFFLYIKYFLIYLCYIKKFFFNFNLFNYFLIFKKFFFLYNKINKLFLDLYKYHKYKYINNFKINNLKLLNKYNDILNILIHDINKSKINIDIIFYICKIGGGVDYLFESLIFASNRGVLCKVLIDHVGSFEFFCSSYFFLFKNFNIYILNIKSVNFLNFFLQRIDLRSHKKIILIDNFIFYTGSMNIIDPFIFKKYSYLIYWFDIIIRFEYSLNLFVNFFILFYLYNEIIKKKKNFFLNNFFILPFNLFFNNYFCIVFSSFVSYNNFIYQIFLIFIYTAKKQIIITTPYLILNKDFLYAICNAAKHNIEVNIIIPFFIDSNFVYWASRYCFFELLNSGVFIYQLNGVMLHTKSILIDGELSLIGSANFDLRSLNINSELILVIDDFIFSKNLFFILKDYMINSDIIIISSWNKRSFLKRFFEYICFFFHKLL